MNEKLKKALEYNLNIFAPFVAGGLVLLILNYFLDLVDVFGSPNSYVYYYVFSTIVQGYVALVAFLGTLAVFKLQRDESRKSPGVGKDAKFISTLEEAQRDLTFDLKKFVVVCLFDVGIALIGIPLIPLFILSWFGPAYLGGSIALSLWTLFLSYPIIQAVLKLGPEEPYQGG
jgi:uncharacterized Tic20 family protein